MIRVLFLIDELAAVGGTERQLQYLVSHIDRTRFDVQIATLYASDNNHGAAIGGFDCPVRTLGMRKLASLDGLQVLRSLVKVVRQERIDIIQTFFIDSSMVGVLAARLARCRVVIGRRDLGYWHTPKLLFAARALQRFADAYIANSNAVKELVANAEHVPNEKIHVVYNGYFGLSTGHPSLARPANRAPAAAPIVGIVSNLRPVKRVDRFIEMAALLAPHDVQFLVLGHGSMRSQLLDQAARAGLQDRLNIVHSTAEVLANVSRFDVGVLTSESEGLPNALIEYGIMGVPAVAFDVGGNREVIEDEISGFLIAPYDIHAMAERVGALLADVALRDRMGARAHTLCSTRFAGPTMVTQTEHLYMQLASSAS